MALYAVDENLWSPSYPVSETNSISFIQCPPVPLLQLRNFYDFLHWIIHRLLHCISLFSILCLFGTSRIKRSLTDSPSTLKLNAISIDQYWIMMVFQLQQQLWMQKELEKPMHCTSIFHHVSYQLDGGDPIRALTCRRTIITDTNRHSR